MNIEGSGALVAGGASGLGEATARRLHARGAAVTIADVNAEKGQALADELGVRFVSCDVREEDQVRAACPEPGQTCLAVRLRGDREALSLERVGDRGGQGRFVLDEQDRGASSARSDGRRR